MIYNTVLTYLSTKLSDTFKYYPQDLCTVYLICLHEWFLFCGLNAGEYTSPIDPMGCAVVTSTKTQLTDQGWAPDEMSALWAKGGTGWGMWLCVLLHGELQLWG